MDISSASMQDLGSIKQAIGMANIRKAMNQDAMTVSTLISDMKVANAKVMEHSITPHKGSSIDVRI